LTFSNDKKITFPFIPDNQ